LLRHNIKDTIIMHKFKEKKQESQTECCTATSEHELSYLFKKVYDFLDVPGDKKQLHCKIQEATGPLVNISTIRVYCNNLHRLPEKVKLWYLKIMIALLLNQLSTKIEIQKVFISESEKAARELANKLTQLTKEEDAN